MFDFIKNLEEQNFIPNCLSSGICAVDPTLSALEELLLSELRQIAFYVVRAKEFGYENLKIMSEAIKGLSIGLLNTNFCEKQYAAELENLIELKKEVKKSYLHFCKNNPTSCELISFPNDIYTKNSIGKMIKEGEKSLLARYKFVGPEKIRLLELISLLSKMNARNIEKIKSLEPDFSDFDFEVLRIFSLTNFPATRIEKLKRRILEFSHVAFKIQDKLNSVLKKHYGTRQSVDIKLNAKAGKSILVSGSSLSELMDILDSIKDEKINVYTHNALFIAHSYPKFQKYKNLIGHWGGENTQSDFANFKGVIFVTKNSSQKIDTLYRGLIFSSEMINAKGVVKIEGNNFEPLIEAALKHEGFDEDEPEKFTHLEYNLSKINEAIELKKDIVVFVGNSKNIDFSNLIGDKIIINLECPIEVDLLYHIVEKVKAKEVQAIAFFTQCGPIIINLLLSLIECGLKEIYLSKCPLAVVSPHVIDSLEQDFGVKVIR